jgi:hypothetical protein
MMVHIDEDFVSMSIAEYIVLCQRALLSDQVKLAACITVDYHRSSANMSEMERHAIEHDIDHMTRELQYEMIELANAASLPRTEEAT